MGEWILVLDDDPGTLRMSKSVAIAGGTSDEYWPSTCRRT